MVVLGSGAAGLTAALTTALHGLSAAVLEHMPVVGGTSARSSGSVWIPANQYMRAAGIDDDAGDRTYLDALVGDRAPREMRLAVLQSAPEMQAQLEAQAGIGVRPFTAAPDDRQDMPGAVLGPFSMDNALWFPSSNMPRPDGTTAVWPHILLDPANSEGHSVPCWMICNRTFIRRNGLGLLRPRTPSLSRYIQNGYLTTAPTSRRWPAALASR